MGVRTGPQCEATTTFDLPWCCFPYFLRIVNIKRLPSDPQKPEFSAQLRSIMAFHEFSIVDLAGFANVSYKTALNWYHGRHAPPTRSEILTQEDVIDELVRAGKGIAETKAKVRSGAYAAQPPAEQKPTTSAESPRIVAPTASFEEFSRALDAGRPAAQRAENTSGAEGDAFA